MTSRQAGRGISTIAAQRRKTGGRRGGARQAVRRRNEALRPQERRRLLQLVACSGIFVLLVAAKLLLPAKMAQFNERLSGALRQNMDVKAVFSAVGRAITGEDNAGGAMEDVYQAVFHPEKGETMETAALEELPLDESAALDDLREYRMKSLTADQQTAEGEADAKTEQTEVSTLAYVLYSDRNLPEDVSLEQAILGFDYCTPVCGTLTSNFGYREHPVEGEERFHYGIDIGAAAGTEIGCFADGTVTAVGESSSYGKYITVAHEGGYSTLYAHCSRIIASSGASVKEGDVIAEVGETGVATGPHLHFELHEGSQYLNPIYYVSLA